MWNECSFLLNFIEINCDFIKIAILNCIDLHSWLWYDLTSISLESSGYREFHGINPQKSSQHFLPRIATAKTELPDITKKLPILFIFGIF